MDTLNKSLNKDSLRAFGDIVNVFNPVAGWILKLVIDKFVDDASEQIAKSESSEEIRRIGQRQHLAVELMERRAHAAQELALAQRIVTAAEVEVEEYYGGSDEAALGLDAKTDGETAGATLGLRGKSGVIKKRVIRLKGELHDTTSMEFVQRNLVDNGS